MTTENILEGKKILIVDDEPDVLEALQDLLSMCHVTRASTFEEAESLMETQDFDLAVLDIMGVKGYDLLKKAKEKHVIVAMLTANALSVENLSKSYEKGAASYIPKEEMANIATYLSDILEAKEKGKSFWWRWLERMEDYFDKKFGPEWQEKNKIKIR